MLENPTVEQVRELLVRAVEEKGADYVYPHASPNTFDDFCVYREPDGSPSCIVGHVLAYAGVQVSDEDEGHSAYSVVPPSWGEEMREALTEAQQVQDKAETWGEALAAFDKSLGLVQS